MSLLTNCSDESFAIIVKNSFSIKECEEKLGYNSYSGSVASQIKQRIKNLNLDTSHFNNSGKVIRTPENIFIENSTADQSTLRKFYRNGEYTPYICDICGQEPIWQGKELTLILDHKNGINNDDRLENLHWVCPNCNQQLDTTGSRNKAYKTNIKNKNTCIDCGKEIFKGSLRCKKCDTLYRQEVANSKREERVSREELKRLIRTTPFTQIGKKFEVSDNTIRKWCKKFGLPTKVSDIKQYSEEEWSKI